MQFPLAGSGESKCCADVMRISATLRRRVNERGPAYRRRASFLGGNGGQTTRTEICRDRGAGRCPSPAKAMQMPSQQARPAWLVDTMRGQGSE